MSWRHIKSHPHSESQSYSRIRYTTTIKFDPKVGLDIYTDRSCVLKVKFGSIAFTSSNIQDGPRVFSSQYHIWDIVFFVGCQCDVGCKHHPVSFVLPRVQSRSTVSENRSTLTTNITAQLLKQFFTGCFPVVRNASF